MDFEVLYNTYYKQIFSYLMTLTHNKELAEEITQETFVRAMKSPEKYRGEAQEFTWLCSIAKNYFIDLKRKQDRITDFPEDYEPEADIDVSSQVEDEESTYRVHKILHTLEEPYKEVFQLRVFGELSFQKIGSIFGKTENWARVTYHRARLKIVERMENDG